MVNTAHILICSYAMCVEWQLWRTCHSAVMGLGADGQPTCSSALEFWGPKSSWGSFNHLLVSGLCWCTEHAQAEMMRAWTWGLSVWFWILLAWQLCLEEETFWELPFQVATRKLQPIWWHTVERLISIIPAMFSLLEHSGSCWQNQRRTQKLDFMRRL